MDDGFFWYLRTDHHEVTESFVHAQTRLKMRKVDQDIVTPDNFRDVIPSDGLLLCIMDRGQAYCICD
jgi:hypothetical protein